MFAHLNFLQMILLTSFSFRQINGLLDIVTKICQIQKNAILSAFKDVN